MSLPLARSQELFLADKLDFSRKFPLDIVIQILSESKIPFVQRLPCIPEFPIRMFKTHVREIIRIFHNFFSCAYGPIFNGFALPGGPHFLFRLFPDCGFKTRKILLLVW